MRGLGCLTVSVLVLGGIAVGADLAVTNYAERRLADNLVTTLDAEEVTVDLQGWPVAARMLFGSIPQVAMTSTEVELDNGATLDQLDVTLTDVEVKVSDLRNNSERLPPADEGTFEAQLGEEAILAMLGVPTGVVDAKLQDGIVRLSAAGVRLDAEVVASKGDVVIQLQGPLAQLLGGVELPIDLSNEPGAPYVEDVEISDGVMSVSGRLEEVQR